MKIKYNYSLKYWSYVALSLYTIFLTLPSQASASQTDEFLDKVGKGARSMERRMRQSIENKWEDFQTWIERNIERSAPSNPLDRIGQTAYDGLDDFERKMTREIFRPMENALEDGEPWVERLLSSTSRVRIEQPISNELEKLGKKIEQGLGWSKDLKDLQDSF